MLLFLSANPVAFDFKAIFSNVKTDASFYIVLFYAVLILIMFCLAIKPKQALILSKTKKITLISMLTALTVIANIFTFGPEKTKFSTISTVGFVSGYMLGPIAGFSVGFLGDLIGAIVAPQGIYNPILAIGSGMWGFIPGLIFWYTGFNDYVKTVISFILSYIIASVLLNNFAIYMMYLYGVSKTTLFTYLGARMPFTFLFTLINLAISLALLVALRQLKKGVLIKLKK